ncbi:OsmC family protein [Candidatus Albibeggiatoa sp. nov. NOAA]|uniref:OsmC family protein n=1 Tax=Candidatus Albibeggiatoa sp. nov. NOAA TaxID=3162724 RepID=UPI003303DE3B|nr:OsmC family protein [Thiotrichaceae bacterium]
MDIKVDFGQGMQVNAHFGDFTVATDQPEKLGGLNTAPAPYEYFLASLATCAGFFVARFCQKRDISMEGISINMRDTRNEKTHLVENVEIELVLPSSFPEKYRSALIRATNECSVKKTLQNPPNIETVTKIVD